MMAGFRMDSNSTSVIPNDPFLRALDDDGFAVIPGVLAPDDVDRARGDLDAILAETATGRDDFEGRNTRRVYRLFGRTRAFDAAATHPILLAVLDHLLGRYQLSSPAGIEIGPGERAQALHHDDSIYPIARPHPEIVATAMLPLVDFSETNGGTRLVPGSHKWVDERPDASTPTVSPALRAGDALVYRGTLWHGGGANTTLLPRLGVVLHFAASWLRPAENHVLAVPPEVVRTLPKRLQELLGYNIHPPFLGNVDGHHPRRTLGH
jgi:ectoine hydroxylase-related dioxygenase (phytanoyl-CoA dioxygenase family)